MQEIGEQCGFQDMSYFARTFRKIQGCTPKEYRNRNEDKETGTMERETMSTGQNVSAPVTDK